MEKHVDATHDQPIREFGVRRTPICAVHLTGRHDKPGELKDGKIHIRNAELAHFVQLAKGRGQDKPAQDQAFIAGMFSLLGVLFGMPLPEVLAPLTMSDAVQEAVLEYKGDLGAMLRLCEAVEEADFEQLAAQLA